MASWKKVIVSGSNLSQLANDANYLVDGQDGAILSGSFSGSFQGDGSGLTNVPASGIVLSELSDGNGINDFSYDGQSTATVSVQADGGTLTVGANGVKVSDGGIDTTQLAADAVTNAKIATGAVNNDSIANDSITVAQLSGSAVITESEGIASNDVDTAIPTAAAVKDYVDTKVTAEDLDFQGDSGTGAVDLDSQTLDIAGGTGLDTVASGQTLTVNISNGGVDTLQLATGAVETDKIADANVTNAKLANDGLMIGNTDISLGATGSSVDGLTLTGAVGSGSFSGSFQGDGSGLTNLPASGIVLATLQDGNGIADFSYNGQSGATVAVQADGGTLTVGANGVKVSDAGITATQLNTSVAGTGLSGGGGTALSVDYGSTAGTAAEGNTSVTFTGTNNEIELSTNTFTTVGGGGSVTIGLPNDVSITQDLTVGRNLVVQGTASFQHTTDLAIADRFILLASGSTSAGDGGIVVQQTTQDVGDAFAFEATAQRWGIADSVDASDNTITFDAFMAAVLTGNASSDAAIDALVEDRYEAKGNIFIGDDEGIWIYS